MSDDFKREEKVEKRKEPSRVGATFIKYGFITIIVLIILYFLANFFLPMFDGNGEENSGNNGNNAIEIDIDDGGNDDGGNNES
ncbi:hypothetical protein [Salisediminibacterium beveridgei]|uniref:Uncharacterized protein n=1 Tax=Salisediminibacterium beveridgei TaxID=632773 RepID=A0A1D7QTE9_9BACI|nr:hypothetical protein [Salisediminibacterium beveridgei]AOM82302.1 hypothetical protein BBEV_0932 [Salisediminibacterium beveridgei]